MWRLWGRIEVCTGCWWGSLRERDHWGDQDVDGDNIKMDLQDLCWIFLYELYYNTRIHEHQVD